MSDIEDYISVTPPYRKFENVRVTKDGKLHASFVPEQTVYERNAVVSFSEMARHMAIAGSMICAHYNPKKRRHFYLAVQGTSTRVPHPESRELVNIVAEYVANDDPTSTFMQARIYSNGYTLDCMYFVKPNNHVVRVPETYDLTFYQKNQALLNVTLTKDSVSGIAQLLKFPGHFPDMNAYAVASIGSWLTEFISLLHPSGYEIIKTNFSAHRLVLAHTPCVFRAEPNNDGSDFNIRGTLMEVDSTETTPAIEFLVHIVAYNRVGL